MGALVYALSGKSHEFSESECNLCHVDVDTSPDIILPDVTLSCGKCHAMLEQVQSHPTDIYPGSEIPEDMPLIEGRLTCLTCHYAHPSKKRQMFITGDFFLRRPYKGPAFCSTCHIIDENKHIVFNKVHKGSYVEKSRKTRIDMESLTCIECHDEHITKSRSSLGAGIWKHGTGTLLPHPVGISYEESHDRKKHGFKPAGLLRKEVKLYEGKIGCGSCHNIYSKEKYMLVISNERSTLCLECHIK
ncbi:MAG: cytochrome c3 family protein [Nitrospiraceae bacterium]|nr:MAG: cytochrome c3 family protein [Nitrospiraceae bacterium]